MFFSSETSHSKISSHGSLVGAVTVPERAVAEHVAGHWGTCPGLSIVYSHLNYLVRQKDLNIIYVVGPGHGAPAILASLWIEGSLQRFYPQYGRNKDGLRNLITKFSAPGGPPRSVAYHIPAEGAVLSNNVVISILKRLARFMKVASLVMLSQSPLVPLWTIRISLSPV